MFESEPIPSHSNTSGHYGLLVSQLRHDELDAQPFGIIRLDTKGVILAFNAHEERASRRSRKSVLARNFFTEVAPCTQVKEFYGLFLAGMSEGRLDVTFGFVFPSPRRERERHVFVTLFFQPAESATWVITRDSRSYRN
jgi:photoactive yellow protein